MVGEERKILRSNVLISVARQAITELSIYITFFTKGYSQYMSIIYTAAFGPFFWET